MSFGYRVLGFGAGGGVVPITATGGDTVADYVGSDGFTYRYHQFTNTGNFVVVSLGSDETWGNKIDYLVQAGGAGGGNHVGGGGGAGGGLTASAVVVTPSTYAITIGTGGGSQSGGGATPAYSVTAQGGGNGGSGYGGGAAGGAMAQNMKIMQYLLPIMMLFIFNRIASGLSLYYLIFNVLSIVQQYYINRSTHKTALAKS